MKKSIKSIDDFKIGGMAKVLSKDDRYSWSSHADSCLGKTFKILYIDKTSNSPWIRLATRTSTEGWAFSINSLIPLKHKKSKWQGIWKD